MGYETNYQYVVMEKDYLFYNGEGHRQPTPPPPVRACEGSFMNSSVKNNNKNHDSFWFRFVWMCRNSDRLYNDDSCTEGIKAMAGGFLVTQK
jgi:hypothetical protein